MAACVRMATTYCSIASPSSWSHLSCVCMCTSSVVRCPSSVCAIVVCLHVSVNTIRFLVSLLGVQAGVHALRGFSLRLLDMTRLSRLLQIEQEQDDDDLLLALMVGTLKKKRQHRWWVHPINRKRKRDGTYYHLVKEDLMKYGEKFREYFRLTREQFDQLHHLLEPLITKQSMTQEAIGSRERLALCLR